MFQFIKSMWFAIHHSRVSILSHALEFFICCFFLRSVSVFIQPTTIKPMKTKHKWNAKICKLKNSVHTLTRRILQSRLRHSGWSSFFCSHISRSLFCFTLIRCVRRFEFKRKKKENNILSNYISGLGSFAVFINRKNYADLLMWHM